MCALSNGNQIPVKCAVAELLSVSMERAARAEAALEQYRVDAEVRVKIEAEAQRRKRLVT